MKTISANCSASALPRDLSRIVAALGLLVFVVALGGLYGLTSYLATMRRREVGVRKALGATTATLCLMLARESTRVLLSGAVIGVALGLSGRSSSEVPRSD